MLPSQLDRTPSTCPYIVNKGKEGEHICGKGSKSGPLWAEHRKRQPQAQDDSFLSGLFSRLGFYTSESTSEADTPARPSTEHNNNQGRIYPNTPTPPTTTPSKHSSTSAMNTPTMIDHNSAPRRSSRNPTPKATPLPVNNRAVHSLELTPHLLLQSDLVVKALESSLNGSRA
uniref:TATA box-binding protein-like protein 2 n=1 Tax=Talaromyces marneffei PM1 TaxID=1077442 RepID=A0A093VJF5_TALMA